jgi:signal transduction histidine kinase
MKLNYQKLQKYCLGTEHIQNTQAHILMNASLILAFFSLIFLILSWFIDFKEGKIILLINFCVYFSFPFLLRLKIPLFFLSQLFILHGGFVVVSIIIFDGGLYSNVLPWMAAIPTISLLVTNKKTSYFWLVVSLLIVIIFAILDQKGFKFPRTHNQELYALSQSLVIMGLISVIFTLNLIFEQARSNAVIKLNQKNQELNQQRSEIMIQAAQLQELNQLKTQILSAISHDFRSPLVSIKSVLSVLDDKLLSSEDFDSMQKELTHRLDVTLNSMDNLLQWSKSQMGESSHTDKSIFSVAKAIESSVQLLKDMSQHKKIIIIQDLPSEIMIYADLEQIKIIVRNLLSNAIKFSNEGSNIYITVSERDNKVNVSIRDEGIGIDQNQLDSLFVLGKHKSTFGTNNEKGTGLGLLLFKEYIEQNGGDFEIKSEKNKGSEFKFTLPKSSENLA